MEGVSEFPQKVAYPLNPCSNPVSFFYLMPTIDYFSQETVFQEHLVFVDLEFLLGVLWKWRRKAVTLGRRSTEEAHRLS